MAQNNRSASTNWRRNVAGAIDAALEDERQHLELQEPIIQPVPLNIQQGLIESPHQSSSEHESEEDIEAIHEPDLLDNNGANNEAEIADADHQNLAADLGISDCLI